MVRTKGQIRASKSKVRLCRTCDKSLKGLASSIRYCQLCKIERLKYLAKKARERTKLWRLNNHERAKKKQIECYKKNRDYYLMKGNEYRRINILKIKLREIKKRNEEPHRRILIEAKVPIVCKICGRKENQRGYQLSSHHIDGNKNNNVLENLVWLCESCHQYIHNPRGIHSEMIKIGSYKKESGQCL